MLRRWLGALFAAALAVPAAALPRFEVRTLAVGPGAEMPLAVPEWGLVFVPYLGGIAVIDPVRETVLERLVTGLPTDRLAFHPRTGRLVAAMQAPAGSPSAVKLEVFEKGLDGIRRIAEVWAENLATAGIGAAVLNPVNDSIVVTDAYHYGWLDPGTLSWTSAPDRLDGVTELVVEPVSASLFVTEEQSDEVIALSAHDPSQVKLSFLNYRPQAVRYSPTRDRIYVVNPIFLLVQVIDPNTGEDEVATCGQGAWSLALDDAAGWLYVGHLKSPFVSRVDLTDLATENIALPGPGGVVAMAPDGRTVYSVGPGRAEIDLIDAVGGTLVASYAARDAARYAIVDPTTGKLVTANTWAGTASILRPRPDPDRSDFWVSAEYIDADGRTTSRAWVVPRDSNGDPIGSGLAVEIEATAGTLLGSVTDVGDGSYWQDLQSTTSAETAILKARVEGEAIATRPRVSFTLQGWPSVRIPDPEWGLTAGNERVVIRGGGFASDLRGPGGPSLGLVNLEVYFGRARAQVDSWTDTEIVCFTPPHAAGVVDVTVSKYVSDERRDSVLRGGFTYVESDVLDLRAASGSEPGSVRLLWSDGPTGPVRIERSSRKDFGADVVDLGLHPGPEAGDVAPAFPRLSFYRLSR